MKDNTFTYYLNMLQLRASPGAPQMFETLNPPPELKIDQSKVHARWTMQHPVMDKRTLDAQRMYTQATAAAPGCGRRLAAGAAVAGAGTRAQQQVSNRNNRVWLAGAYLHHGFHEDGCRSGIEAARCVWATPLSSASRTVRAPPPKHTVFAVTRRMRGCVARRRGAEAADAFATTRNKFKYAHTLDCVDIDGGPRYWWGALPRGPFRRPGCAAWRVRSARGGGRNRRVAPRANRADLRLEGLRLLHEPHIVLLRLVGGRRRRRDGRRTSVPGHGSGKHAMGATRGTCWTFELRAPDLNGCLRA